MVAVVINIDGVQAGLCIVTCLSFKESWLLSSLRGPSSVLFCLIYWRANKCELHGLELDGVLLAITANLLTGSST